MGGFVNLVLKLNLRLLGDENELKFLKSTLVEKMYSQLTKKVCQKSDINYKKILSFYLSSYVSLKLILGSKYNFSTLKFKFLNNLILSCFEEIFEIKNYEVLE